MKKIFFIISVLTANVSHAQEITTPKDSAESPFVIVEQMPEFVGGEAAKNKFIIDNIEFPKAEHDAGIQGTCYVSFVVEKDGSITYATVL
jgi:protein TonB